MTRGCPLGLVGALSGLNGACPALLLEPLNSALRSADLRLLWRSRSLRASATDSCSLCVKAAEQEEHLSVTALNRQAAHDDLSAVWLIQSVHASRHCKLQHALLCACNLIAKRLPGRHYTPANSKQMCHMQCTPILTDAMRTLSSSWMQ